MGIPIQQPSTPSAQDQAQKQGQEQETCTGNRHDPSPGPDGGHQRSEQEQTESLAVQHGSSNGSGSMESRLQDVPLPRGEPLEPDHQDLQGIGAWADDSIDHASTSDFLDLA